MSAEKSAGVRDGMEVFAFDTSETPPNAPGRTKAAFKTLSTSPAQLQRATGRCLSPVLAHLCGDLDLSDRGPHAGILTPRKVRTASNIAKLPNLLKRTFMMHRTR